MRLPKKSQPELITASVHRPAARVKSLMPQMSRLSELLTSGSPLPDAPIPQQSAAANLRSNLAGTDTPAVANIAAAGVSLQIDAAPPLP
jgi:hypothetical protein